MQIQRVNIMNVRLEKKKAIVALYKAGVPVDILVSVTGLEEKTVKSIINWGLGRSRSLSAIFVEFPEIKLHDVEGKRRNG